MAFARARGPAVDVTQFLSRVIESQLAEPALRLRPLVLCGPSGVGKSHTMRQLVALFSDSIRPTVSTTTRLPRGAEQDGVEYHFVAAEAFKGMVNAGKFIESDTIHGNMYGMTIDEVSNLRTRVVGVIPPASAVALRCL